MNELGGERVKLEIKQTEFRNSVLLNGIEIGDNITALTLEMLPPRKPKITMTVEIYPDVVVMECDDTISENDRLSPQ